MEEKESIFKDIQDMMVETANKIVGNVGKPTEERYSVTKEDYVEFVCLVENMDDILQLWAEWVESYLKFSRNHFKGRVSMSLAPLYIHWRIFPEIKKERNYYSCYARLLITNLTTMIDYNKSKPDLYVLKKDYLKKIKGYCPERIYKGLYEAQICSDRWDHGLCNCHK